MDKAVFYFQQYVKRAGSRANAAKRLGIGVGMVGHLLCGRRGISSRIAQAIEQDTQGEIRKAWLRPDLWGDEKEVKKDA